MPPPEPTVPVLVVELPDGRRIEQKLSAPDREAFARACIETLTLAFMADRLPDAIWSVRQPRIAP